MMKNQPGVIVSIGECLWDILPNAKRLGGATLNFGYHCQLLGFNSAVVSRIGIDILGQEAESEMHRLGLNTAYVQKDKLHATGINTFNITPAGEPQPFLKDDVAYDYIEWSDVLEELALRAKVVHFGTLAQRHQQSRDTIQKFLKTARDSALLVCDVNLRQGCYSHNTVIDSLEMCAIVKATATELSEIVKIYKIPPADDITNATVLLDRSELDLICVTRGSEGSILVSRTEVVEHPAFPVEVADVVGCGDAFLAAAVYHYLGGSSLQITSKAANYMAAWVAREVGATPSRDHAVIQEVCPAK
jgi:fructokinase